MRTAKEVATEWGQKLADEIRDIKHTRPKVLGDELVALIQADRDAVLEEAAKAAEQTAKCRIHDHCREKYDLVPTAFAPSKQRGQGDAR